MSKHASPVAIGLFMIGAIVLFIIGIGMFVTTGWFDQRTTFMSYFEESVNGLQVGADVKFEGVPVGRVREILIRVDTEGQTFSVPVSYDVDLSHIKTSGDDQFVNLSEPDVLRREIRDGLRAQLQLESFVTGQLYIELTYTSSAEPPAAPPRRAPHPVIPTRGSLFATLGQEAGELMEGLRDVDIGELNANLMMLLLRANQKLDQLDVAGINRSLQGAAVAFEDLARSPEIRTAMREVPGMTAQFTATMAEMQVLVRRLQETVDPMQEQFAGTTEEVALTLRAMRDAATETQGLFSSDYGIGYQMEEALASLSEAADALRLLAVQLEQNPDMLIRGKRSEDR